MPAFSTCIECRTPTFVGEVMCPDCVPNQRDDREPEDHDD